MKKHKEEKNSPDTRPITSTLLTDSIEVLFAQVVLANYLTAFRASNDTNYSCRESRGSGVSCL
ncbi:hypothetical protein Baya_0232 [Bagarius yarrelli]|uniref:Uncharacterized protein n=1 Tax=Bagarius yarrelli TaxID=175774 RepID=A0A556THP5_BAGYA|nr:hypothetical protein Baya_0232 [Bagarius yarrelli]